MTRSELVLLLVGPRPHGVVDFGIDLAEALRRNHSGYSSVHVATIAELFVGHDPARGVHLQFTDRVFGATPAAAADAVTSIVADAATRGARVTATLHDVPQPSDGGHFGVRTAAYAKVCDAVAGVVVNSDHERLLLAELGVTPQRLATIALPVDAQQVAPRAPTSPPSVGVFGFLYPGKGHMEVMAALRDLDPGLGMVAIGAPSAGHEDLAESLLELARQQGRTVTVTGYLPDDRLFDALREVTVPVAHHRHVSASGSLNTWIAAGRRPLAPANRYTVEMSERNPGALLLYEDDDAELGHAIGRALADPASTWLPPGAVVTPTRAQAADQYDRLLRRWHS